MADVIIFGASETSLLFQYLLDHDSPHAVVAFTVDGKFLRESSLGGVPVVALEELQDAFPPSGFSAAVPLGFTRINRFRAEKSAALAQRGYSLISYVSSKASVWPDLRIGANTYIQEGAVIQPHVRIGNDVIVGPGVTIGHHSLIEDHCFIGPDATLIGQVRMKAFTVVGGNATIRDGVHIGENSIIGAGALVTRHLGADSVVLAASSERIDGKTIDAASLLLPLPKPGPGA
jgi:sugar O-acyltransferase (sialic acid O-acetyltransferase NeuD family)